MRDLRTLDIASLPAITRSTDWNVKMRKIFALAVLAMVLALAATQFGPSALFGDQGNGYDHEPAPEFAGISTWLNSPPLTMAALKGRVVLVQFWTYSCINSLRTLPYVTSWYKKYKDRGFIVVGIHTPEFAFEKQTSNVEAAVKRLGVTYPVGKDDRYSTWRAYGNQYWPAAYLIDRTGTIVMTQFGEGNYKQLEETIANLVGEHLPLTRAPDSDLSAIDSPEMYFGADKNRDAIVPSQTSDAGERFYTAPEQLPLNRFALSGAWKLGKNDAMSSTDGAEIVLRFWAPKVNLVAGSSAPQTVLITVDGKPQSPVTIQGSQLYPIYVGTGGEHLLRVTAPKAGLSAYTFTFG
jgi:thiol-disulfide isomerase/thioredoxin